MNPFRPLLKLLDFVLGHDLHERAAEEKPQVRRPPRRDPAPRGDGFDAGSRGPRVDLGGGVKQAPKLPDEPVGPPAVIEPSNFNASLDDLSDLVKPPSARGGAALDFAHVVDEPLQAQPEFIPEGGMSTESLMSEFSSLDAETQAAAVELAAAKELAQSIEQENPEKFVDSFESAPPALSLNSSTVLPLPSGEGQGEAKSAAETTSLDFSHVVDEPMETKPEFVASGGMSTESLMSEFSSLDAETQATAVAQAAAQEAARESDEEEAESPETEAEAESETEADSFEAGPAPQQQERMTPAWLIPATTAAPKHAAPLPPPEMSTESLMSEFESLDAETQQAAIDEAAAKERARQEAEEAKMAEEALVPPPAPHQVLTPAWLLPTASATPKKTTPPLAPAMATESLMSEFESLAPETQQAAIDEAAAKEVARQEAEEAKKAELAPHPGPLPAAHAAQGDGVPTPAWLLPTTSTAPRKTAPPPAPAMATESLMSEFESLAPETQQAAIEEAAAKELARQKAEEAKTKAAEPAGPPAASEKKTD